MSIAGTIRDWARRQPGGVIRWREARDIYRSMSASARKDERMGSLHYHMSLKRLLGRDFERVEGIDGHYVLKEMTFGED